MKMSKDPVKHCELYKDDGCSHVDGFLCDYETCEMRLEYMELQKKNLEFQIPEDSPRK
jgi:hypothetical protein